MRKLQIAGGTAFVSAWIVGLVLAAGGPSPGDFAMKIASYFAAHEHEAMIGHLLIDGVAGAAIIAIALSLRSFLRDEDERLSRLTLAAGVPPESPRSCRPRWGCCSRTGRTRELGWTTSRRSSACSTTATR